MKAWGISDPALRVLPTASRFISRDRLIQDQYDERTRRESCRIVDKCEKLVNSYNAEYLALQTIEGIDAGEALLISAAAAEEAFYILTADKRCLRALATSGPTEILNRLEQRIICLEQLVLKLMQASADVEKVIRRINKAVECEVSVTEAFKFTDSPAIIQRLQAEVDRLRNETGNLLVP